MTGADVPPEEQDHGEDGPYLFCHDCGVFGTDPCLPECCCAQCMPFGDYADWEYEP